jgi:predicted Zn-ribbon and HTH transcriptional regulator
MTHALSGTAKKAAIVVAFIAGSIVYFAVLLFIPGVPLVLTIGIYAFVLFIVIAPRIISRINTKAKEREERTFTPEASVKESLDMDIDSNLMYKCNGCGYMLTPTMKRCPNCNRANPHYTSSHARPPLPSK